MKLTDNANFAMQMLFDDNGRMDEAFILKAWPYSSMDPGEIEKLKSGLIELEAFGLVSTQYVVKNGRKFMQKVLNRKKSPDAEPLWAKGMDSNLPVQ
jgi:hypothetical protein